LSRVAYRTGFVKGAGPDKVFSGEKKKKRTKTNPKRNCPEVQSPKKRLTPRNVLIGSKKIGEIEEAMPRYGGTEELEG